MRVVFALGQTLPSLVKMEEMEEMRRTNAGASPFSDILGLLTGSMQNANREERRGSEFQRTAKLQDDAIR